jgi:hypothetical protein
MADRQSIEGTYAQGFKKGLLVRKRPRQNGIGGVRYHFSLF